MIRPGRRDPALGPWTFEERVEEAVSEYFWRNAPSKLMPEEAYALAAAAAARVHALEVHCTLGVGTRVTVYGLERRRELNGQRGVGLTEPAADEQGRYLPGGRFAVRLTRLSAPQWFACGVHLIVSYLILSYLILSYLILWRY